MSPCGHDHDDFPSLPGMTEKSLAALMKKYEAEKEGLHNTQDKNRHNQEDKLKVLALNIWKTCGMPSCVKSVTFSLLHLSMLPAKLICLEPIT